MDVSIIIVSYNTEELLKNCLASLYEYSSGFTFEVLVIDNNSQDGSVRMLEKNYQAVRIIRSAENLGFGPANNEAAKYAEGNYLLFLNSDMLLLNNAIYILFNTLEKDPRIGICGGNLFTSDLKPAVSFSQNMPGIGTDIDYFFGNLFSKMRYHGNVYFNSTPKILHLNGYSSGADLMIHRSLFSLNNGFDPSFFMYYEETELTYRIRKQNFLIGSVPAAKFIHLEGGSEPSKKKTAIRSFTSKYLYFKKTEQEKRIPISHLLFVMTAVQRIVIFALSGKKEKVKEWRNLLQWEQEAYEHRS